MHLLTTRTLYFRRADLLGDRFEGSTTKVNLEGRKAMVAHLIDLGTSEEKATELVEKMRELSRAMPRWVFLNCWHEGTDESAAMWELYAQGEGSVAITTSFGRLRDSLKGERHVHIGRVRYADYETEVIETKNSLAPFLVKRTSFRHENEVRALVMKVNYDAPFGPGLEEAILVPVDIERLVREVVVSPLSTHWIDVVKAVVKSLDLKIEVQPSALSAEPLW